MGNSNTKEEVVCDLDRIPCRRQGCCGTPTGLSPEGTLGSLVCPRVVPALTDRGLTNGPFEVALQNEGRGVLAIGTAGRKLGINQGHLSPDTTPPSRKK